MFLLYGGWLILWDMVATRMTLGLKPLFLTINRSQLMCAWTIFRYFLDVPLEKYFGREIQDQEEATEGAR